MPNQLQYPGSVAEVLHPPLALPAEVIEAVRRYARLRPWRGSQGEQYSKVRTLYADLARAHQITTPTLTFTGQSDPDSTRSYYISPLRAVVLRGPRVSVITALHEFGHHLGMTERQASAYSIQLFQLCFPKSFARCSFDRHMLRSRRTRLFTLNSI